MDDKQKAVDALPAEEDLAGLAEETAAAVGPELVPEPEPEPAPKPKPGPKARAARKEAATKAEQGCRPDLAGKVVRGSGPTYYLIDVDGYRRAFLTPQAFYRHGLQAITTMRDWELDGIPLGSDLR